MRKIGFSNIEFHQTIQPNNLHYPHIQKAPTKRTPPIIRSATSSTPNNHSNSNNYNNPPNKARQPHADNSPGSRIHANPASGERSQLIQKLSTAIIVQRFLKSGPRPARKPTAADRPEIADNKSDNRKLKSHLEWEPCSSQVRGVDTPLATS